MRLLLFIIVSIETSIFVEKKTLFVSFFHWKNNGKMIQIIFFISKTSYLYRAFYMHDTNSPAINDGNNRRFFKKIERW